MIKKSFHELKEGMVLAEAVYSKKNNKLLLSEGNRLNSKIIKLFKENDITSVNVSDNFSLFVNPKEVISNHLSNLYDRKIQELAPNLLEANLCDYMKEVSIKARDIAKTIILNEKVIDFCVQIKITSNDILFKHSVNTSVLSLLVAGALKLSDKDMYNIAIGGLLHDIGLCEMPFLIGTKDLSAQEQLLFEEHPTYGYYALREIGISQDICDIVLYHHERYDGKGYPKKLIKNEIPYGARIVNICDQYDDLITINKAQPYEAIEYLYGGGGSLFDESIVSTFIKNLAVYPLGAIVRLTSGEVGIVINVRKNLGPRPIIRVFYNRFNKPLTSPKIVDLGVEKTLFIKEVLS